MVNKILTFWIISFLKRLGLKTPNFLNNFIDELPIKEKSKEILKLRYIKRLSWDLIPDKVYLSKSRVMQIHKSCIELIIELTF